MRHQWEHQTGSSGLSSRGWHRKCVRCGLHERLKQGPKGGIQALYQFHDNDHMTKMPSCKGAQA